jgi:cell division protein FtsB
MAKRSRKQRPTRSSVVLRWLAVGALVLVGLLYYRPFRTYLERREAVQARQAQVRTLEARRAALSQRLRYVLSDGAVAREARRLGYVKPGERLFIVKGISDWRARDRSGATIRPRGR